MGAPPSNVPLPPCTCGAALTCPPIASRCRTCRCCHRAPGSTLDLMLAGTSEAVLMIEGFCDFLTEEQLLEARAALRFLHRAALCRVCCAVLLRFLPLRVLTR